MTEETQDERWQRLSQERIDRPLPKRFYKDVSIGPDFAILLDGRNVKTPLKAKFMLPTQAMAQAVAQEWREQVTHINPALMPLTKLANTTIDRVGVERTHIAGEVVNFAGNDLICYRADRPPDLVALQKVAWDPCLAWALAALDAPLLTTIGVVHLEQPKASLNAFAQHIAALDDYTLCATHNAMTLMGSATLALMLQAKAITPDKAWGAAHVDEDYQVSHWGEDFEASARRKYRLQEFMATALFLDLLITT